MIKGFTRLIARTTANGGHGNGRPTSRLLSAVRSLRP